MGLFDDLISGWFQLGFWCVMIFDIMYGLYGRVQYNLLSR